MDKPFIQFKSGGRFELPCHLPEVARHCQTPSSYLSVLLTQINDEKIYEPLFAGRESITFLDIGANVGLVSVYAAEFCSKIIAVEPAHETFGVLLEMISALPKNNQAKNPEIIPICAALAPEDGVSIFYENDINTTASSTVNTYGTQTTVAGMTLGTILNACGGHVDICKIDAEGAEGKSLSIAQLCNASNKVDTFFIETHNCPESTWESKMEKITTALKYVGFAKIETHGMTIIANK